MVLVLLLFIQSFPLAGQVINGRIFEENTNRSLAYVNIGIISTTIGTVSDDRGNFSMDAGNQSSDKKVRFSIIGYKPKFVSLQELAANEFSKINLQKDSVELGEVTVTKSRLREKHKGNKTSSKNIVTGWNRKILGGERGIRIKAGNKPLYVISLHFHIANNGFEEVLLRVHFRAFENDKPAQHIVNHDILVPVTVESGWVEVNLEEYNLVFEKDVAVTLQPVRRKGTCLEGESCFHISSSMMRIFSTSWLVYKISSEAEWGVKKNWSPGIYLTVYE